MLGKFSNLILGMLTFNLQSSLTFSDNVAHTFKNGYIYAKKKKKKKLH